jgi:hypothetical protein
MTLDGCTLVLTAVLAAVVADAGCNKSYEQERREAAEATRNAEREAQQASSATITSGTLDKSSGEDRAAAAEDEALRQQAEAIASLRREQLDYRGRVQHAIDELDQQLAGVRQSIEGVAPSDDAKGAKSDHADERAKDAKDAKGAKGASKAPAKLDAHARALLSRREILRKDMEAIDRSTAEDWPTVKARLDKDLAKTPEITPRSDRPWGQPAPDTTTRDRGGR